MEHSIAFAQIAITSVVIPDSVTTLGYAAFADTPSLNFVHIGSGLTTILDTNGSTTSSARIFAGTSLTTATIASASFNRLGLTLAQLSAQKYLEIPPGVLRVEDK